jgi:hypothetical protein
MPVVGAQTSLDPERPNCQRTVRRGTKGRYAIDVVVSRFGALFFGDPAAAFACDRTGPTTTPKPRITDVHDEGAVSYFATG